MSMNRRVTAIIDGDSFVVTPDRIWQGNHGNQIRADGYDTPEKGCRGYEKATDRLRGIISDEYVELEPLAIDSFGRLICTVLFNGEDLADHFNDYRT